MENSEVRFRKAKQALFERLYDNLNPEQREAVFTTEGPLLILAGAGSGKTTVLTRRTEFIIRFGNAYYSDGNATYTDSDIKKLEAAVNDENLTKEQIASILDGYAVNRCPAWAVLAITFTNKAANEMKNRLEKLLCAKSADSVKSAESDEAGTRKNELEVRAGTFHSICLRIIRSNMEAVGLRPGFTIYDTDDTKKAILACYKELGIDDKTLAVKNVQNEISRAKDKLITPDEYDMNTDGDYTKERISSIYRLYQKMLAASNALDFDDIIMKTVTLLETNDEIRAKLQRRCKYVSVDEYQDTNYAQFRLVALLSGYYNNLMVVGDDDQSIYRFRGAQIENILNFDKKIKSTKIIRLEQNYRSTGIILRASNAVIANNNGRLGKKLRTDREDGEKIILKRLENHNEEGRYIINRIAELSLREKRKFGDFAVLYRVNAQSNSLENAFAKSGIPYRVLGGTRFFERKEIKDIIAYLSIINNPSDTLRLKRVINEPKRKIGETTVNTVLALADAQGKSMFDVMEYAADYPALARTAAKLAEFAQIIKTLRNIAAVESLPVLIEKTIELSGYRNMILMMGDSELDRLENMQELISTAVDYEKRIKEADSEAKATLAGFLEEVALVADIDNYDSEADAVALMTVHSAKGLEFPVVFMPGFEEGIFPGMQASSNDEELEEERRLAYVALTRAKDRIYLSHVRERIIYGRTAHNQISRFADEIPDDCVENNLGKHRTEGERSAFTAARKHQTVISAELSGGKKQVETKQNVEKFAAGDFVMHATFGHGEIITATDMGGDMLYEIIFDNVGTKKLMGTFAKLKKID